MKAFILDRYGSNDGVRAAANPSADTSSDTAIEIVERLTKGISVHKPSTVQGFSSFVCADYRSILWNPLLFLSHLGNIDGL